ncbi:hypothetical protein L209DRAFT_746957 [Thermothelomyces heterothallicus CBS 203.75]
MMKQGVLHWQQDAIQRCRCGVSSTTAMDGQIVCALHRVGHENCATGVCLSNCTAPKRTGPPRRGTMRQSTARG